MHQLFCQGSYLNYARARSAPVMVPNGPMATDILAKASQVVSCSDDTPYRITGSRFALTTVDMHARDVMIMTEAMQGMPHNVAGIDAACRGYQLVAPFSDSLALFHFGLHP